MIQVENLSYAQGARYLYQNISFAIAAKQHGVLIGSNGTGKSTLLDMIIHPENYVFEGKILRKKMCRIGNVSQFVHHEKARELSVFDYLCEDFVQMQVEMDALCQKMECGENFESTAEQYQAALDEFEAVDGYHYEVNVHKQLQLAGLQHLETYSIADISGGEYKLLQVIRQMLRLPDLLIMDEPDVFLDFENLEGLRELINAYTGTLLVVTHNRYLLNHCFDKVLHLEDRELREFDGSYIEYSFAVLQMKAEMQEAAEKETAWIACQKVLVERLRERATEVDNATYGRSLRARVSYLERLEASRTKMPYLESRMPKIHLPEVYGNDAQEPDFALRVDAHKICFDTPLLQQVTFQLAPHDKVALVGPNGTGKTSLLWDIWKGQSENIVLGPGVNLAFFSQLHGEMFCEDNTVYEEFETLGFTNPENLADYLVAYCLERDTVYHRIRDLSGGEKNLLQLAKIAQSGAGLLLLDEPTSHLDIHAQIALEKAIQDYHGAILMVSHDFYSIANCVDYVLYVEDHTIRRMRSRSFRKMMYSRYFSKEYLELEQRKKDLELRITAQLKLSCYSKVRELSEELEQVIRKMQ